MPPGAIHGCKGDGMQHLLEWDTHGGSRGGAPDNVHETSLNRGLRVRAHRRCITPHPRAHSFQAELEGVPQFEPAQQLQQLLLQQQLLLLLQAQ